MKPSLLKIALPVIAAMLLCSHTAAQRTSPGWTQMRKHEMKNYDAVYGTPKWKKGVEAGPMFSNLAGDGGLDTYQWDFQVRVFARKYFSPRTSIEPGVAYWGMGGRGEGMDKNLSLGYLAVPVDFRWQLVRSTFFLPVVFRGGLYGAYRVNGDDKGQGVAVSDFTHWDAGVRAGVNIGMGSIAFTLMYNRGFVNVLPSGTPGKSFNNGFMLGLTMCFGE